MEQGGHAKSALGSSRPAKSPINLRLPSEIVNGTEIDPTPENGDTGLLLFLGLPAFLAASGCCFLARAGRAVFRSAAFLLAVLLLFAISYWLQTSYIARYTLLFYPTLAAFVPTVILIWFAKRRIPMVLGMAIIVGAALPASATAVSTSASIATELHNAPRYLPRPNKLLGDARLRILRRRVHQPCTPT